MIFKNKILDGVAELWRFRSVLHQMVRQQLVLRYRRTVLGYFWTLLNPLLMMSVTALVFSSIFKMDLKTYAIFLFSGMIPFSYFSSSVTQSCQALIGNEGLIKKVYIPKVLFPLGVSLAVLIDNILTSVALLIIMLSIGAKLSFAMFFIPIAFFIIFLFTFGMGLLFSVATVYFRDLQYVVAVLMQALLFLTPVFYKPESLKGKVEWLIKLNPLTQFIELFRSPICFGLLPTYTSMILSFLFAVFFLAVGLFVFRKTEDSITFRL